MDLGIGDKIAVVTGGSRGLGYGAALSLGKEGCRVVVVARSAEAIADAASRLRAEGVDAYGMTADLTDREQVATLFAKVRSEVGDPDILVYNNAGARDLFFDEATDDDFRHAFDILIMGFVWCVKEMQAHLKQQHWGRIITLGSLCAKEPHKANPMVLHNLGRPAQVGLSKTLSNELGQFGITVNTVATGMLDHDGEAVSRSYARGESPEEIYARRIVGIPVKRTGTAKELGDLTAFLASDNSGFITGQTVLLDGGRVASLM